MICSNLKFFDIKSIKIKSLPTTKYTLFYIFHSLQDIIIIHFSPDFAQSVLRVLLVISLDVVSLLLIALLIFAVVLVVIIAVAVVCPDEELQSSRR